jgi:hypothetical protein
MSAPAGRGRLEANLSDVADNKNTPEMGAGCGADTPQMQVRYADWPDSLPKSRLLTLDVLDRRTAAFRETAQLIAEIYVDLGGEENLSAAEKQLVQHSAILGAYATNLEAQYLRGRNIDVSALCTILNTQRRCFDAIGYQRRPRDVTPSLQGFLDNLKDKEEG